jgi:hypothetical protein
MATQLEQMEKDFGFINEVLGKMKSNLERKSKLLPSMEKQLNEFKKEYEELNTLRNLEATVEALKKMMAWAIVEEAEAVSYINYLLLLNLV